VTFRGGGAGVSCYGISSPLVAGCDDPQRAMTRIDPWRPRKVLVLGVVSHATNVVEHPEVVADRILNFAGVVGRENVIAGTDCGLRGGAPRSAAGRSRRRRRPQPRPRTGRNQVRRELGARGISRANANASSSRSMILLRRGRFI